MATFVCVKCGSNWNRGELLFAVIRGEKQDAGEGRQGLAQRWKDIKKNEGDAYEAFKCLANLMVDRRSHLFIMYNVDAHRITRLGNACMELVRYVKINNKAYAHRLAAAPPCHPGLQQGAGPLDGWVQVMGGSKKE